MPIVGFGDLAPRDASSAPNRTTSTGRTTGGTISGSSGNYGSSGSGYSTPFAPTGAVQTGPRSLFSDPYMKEDNSLGISMMEPPLRYNGSQPTMAQRCCPRMAIPRFTTLLCLVQLIVFIITLIVGGAKYDGAFVSSNSFGGPSETTLYHMGAKQEPDIHSGQVWRLITPIFLHAGILHILSNLLFQIRFGYTLEVRWGWIRFFIVYLLCGIMGNLWSCVLNQGSTSVGASGALFGLVGSDITYVIYNYQYIPHAKREAIFIAFIMLITFLFGASGGTVDNYAHLGGLIGGFPLGIAIPPTLVKRDHEVMWRISGWIVYCAFFLLFALLEWGR